MGRKRIDISSGMKHCKFCGEMRPIEEFPVTNKRKGYRSSYCYFHRSLYQQTYFKEMGVWGQRAYRVVGRARHESIPYDDVETHRLELRRQFMKQNGLDYWTGIPLDPLADWRKDRLRAVQVDRLDPTKGYVRGNIVLASAWSNSARWLLPPNLLEEVCRCIREYYRTNTLSS
jgi:hypothetical protein